MHLTNHCSSAAQLSRFLCIFTVLVLSAQTPAYADDSAVKIMAVAAKRQNWAIRKEPILESNMCLLAADEPPAGARAISLDNGASPRISGLTNPEHIEVVSQCNKEIRELLQQGRNAEALPPAYKVLEITQNDLGPEHPEVAAALNNIAWIEQSQGDYVKARQKFSRAFKIIEAEFGSEDPRAVTYLNNLASLSNLQGDYDIALRLYERARAIREKSFGTEDPDVALIVKSIAGVLKAQGKKDEALAAYEKALEINKKVLPADSVDLATSMNDYACALLDYLRYSEAIPLLEQALSIREKSLGPNHPDIAEALVNLAMVYKDKQNFDRAKQLLERALKISRITVGPEHLDIANLLNIMADIARLQNDLPATQADFLKAAEIIDLHIRRVLPALSFAEQQAFIETRIPAEVGRLLTSCRQGESLAQAYTLIFRWKGLLIDSLKRQVEIARLAEIKHCTPELERLRKVRAEIAGWYLAAGSVPYQQWKTKNDKLTTESESIERELADAINSGIVEDLASRDLKDFQKQLKADESFVDIYLYHFATKSRGVEQHYGAVVTGSIASGASTVLIDLGPASALNEAVKRWLEESRGYEEAQLSWQALRQIVWSSLKTALPVGTTKVWICPDGELSRIPLQLLPETDGEHESPLIAQLDSPTELFKIRATQAGTLPANGSKRPMLLLLGNVDFDSQKGFPPHCGNLERQPFTFKELPGTLRELREIKEIGARQGFPTVVLSGAQATKDALLAQLPLASYVHLAAHGFFFNPKAVERFKANAQAGMATSLDKKGRGAGEGADTARRNPLVESGIALSGANLKDPASSENPGLETAEELIGLDLSRCKLITLSACDTGRGEEITGQGVMGLRASLIASGAKSVIMSVWKVPDEPTAKLMEILYGNLWEKHLPPARALCDAQLETAKTWPRPLCWAGWVLVGQGW